MAASVPVLRWAAHRARLDDGDLAARFHKWPLWLSGKAQPTLKQLEDFGMALGFSHVASGPMVRSSYHADQQAAGIV